MKQVKAKSALIVLLVSVGLGAFWTVGSKPRCTEADWLRVSSPVFYFRTNADGFLTAVSFTVSNTAPHALDFGVAWYELRDRTDGKALASSANPKPLGYVYGQFGPGKMISLPPGSASVQTIETQPSSRVLTEPLFCAEIGWIECNSLRRRIGVALDEGFKEVLNIFDHSWERRFWTADTVGRVFTSNLDVGDYFRTAYGVSSYEAHLPRATGTNYIETAADLAFSSFRGGQPNQHLQPTPR